MSHNFGSKSGNKGASAASASTSTASSTAAAPAGAIPLSSLLTDPNVFSVHTKEESKNNIWIACGDGDMEAVKKLFEKPKAKVTPDMKDENGFTPLMAAATSGNLSLCKWLVEEKKANVNVQDSDGDTALHHCAIAGLSSGISGKDIMAYLIEAGANVNAVNHENKTPLNCALEELSEFEQSGEDDEISPQILVDLLISKGGIANEIEGEDQDEDNDDNDDDDDENKNDDE